MSNEKKTAIILLASLLVGFLSAVTIYQVSQRTHAIERQAEAIETLARKCPCAKQ